MVDFITDEVRAEEFWIDAEEAHQKIATAYLKRFGEDWLKCDLYGLLYLPAHLGVSNESKKLFDLLTDFDFLEAKRRVSSIYDLEADFRAALAGWKGDLVMHCLSSPCAELLFVEEVVGRIRHELLVADIC